MYKSKIDNDYRLLDRFKFYYKDGVLFPSFNPLDVKISEFEEYGYSLNSLIYIKIFEVGDFGSANGFTDILIQLYEEMNQFVKDNPLMFSILSYFASKIGKRMLEKAAKIFEKNLHDYYIFKEGLLFKNEFTLDSFTKAFQLETLRDNQVPEEYWKFVNSLLCIYGFHYDDN